MKKSKFLLAVLLSVSIVFLSGCANIEALFADTSSDFYELKAISKKADIYASVDISGDNILFLTAKGLNDYDLTVFDAATNKITAEKNIEGLDLEYVAGAKFKSENEIIVYDEGSEKAVTFDLDLNQTGTEDYKYVYYRDNAPESSLLDDNFAYEDTYAFTYEASNYNLVFYDDLDKIYVFNGANESIYDLNGKKMFMVEYENSDNHEEASVKKINVKDLENKLCINSFDLESVPAGIFSDILISAVSDKYVCFVNRISNDITGGAISIPYIWKYTEAPKNEAADIKIMTEAEFEAENDSIISEMKSKYGIDIKLNEPTQFGHDVECNAGTLQINAVLSALVECLDLFPENFVKEIYKDAPYSEGFHIHIVDWIDGADAYANDFADAYEICFSTRGFSKGVVFHELMHLMDNRIIAYYDDKGMDFHDEWFKLNPADFEYGSEIDFDFTEEHFVSYYAMTNFDEDIASTFQAMYDAYENDGDYRFEDYEHVRAKVDLICEAIRKAFPSMANADKVCWEKYVDFIK
ncbi:MAG: hypothetical protein J1E05_03115 [Eubacterium sp.]|nr:hypothetical protein [Eubacterium sp.]